MRLTTGPLATTIAATPVAAIAIAVLYRSSSGLASCLAARERQCATRVPTNWRLALDLMTSTPNPPPLVVSAPSPGAPVPAVPSRTRRGVVKDGGRNGAGDDRLTRTLKERRLFARYREG